MSMDLNILQAIDDPAIFGPAFRTPDTWKAWRAFLLALFALPMDDEQLVIYRECTSRAEPPADPVNEGWLICGRRSGKSYTLALIAVFLSCFRDWRPFLGPGECATVMIIAADRRQARTIVRYVKGLLKSVPMLAQTVESETAGVDNPHQPRRHRDPCMQLQGGARLHGRRLPRRRNCFLDDRRRRRQSRLRGLERHPPGDGNRPRRMLLCASSPYARRGALWETYQRHYGQR